MNERNGIVLKGIKVSKFFGGLAALKDVDFEIREGEILGLIGPNGAGKTTLINVITGTEQLTGGDIFFRGRSIKGLRLYEIGRLGIARTFQVVKPFKNMTVFENVLIGALFGKGGHYTSFSHARKKALDVISELGLYEKRNMLSSHLTIPDQKKLELAKALAMDPEILLLDEVMAGLNPREIDEAMELIIRINRRGVTILVIEHVMKAIMGISRRIIVLHHGEKIADGTPDEIVSNEKVIEAYLGERFARMKKKEEEKAL